MRHRPHRAEAPAGRRRAVAALAVAWSLAALPPAWPAAAGDGGGVADDAAGAAASAWEAVKAGTSGLWAAATGLVGLGAPEPFDYLPERLPARDQGFLVLMDEAGYRLAAIETGGRLLGSVRYRFVQERVPSLGDLDRVRRGLAEHADRFSGATASAERRALRALLAVADAQGFRVAAVDLKLLPWPEVRFQLTALDRPLTESERRVVDELRGTPGIGPAPAPAPPAPAPPAPAPAPP